MDKIREILGNATIAYTKMDIDIDSKKIVKNIFDLLEEDKESLKQVNEIDVKNKNGFKIDFEIIDRLKNKLTNIEDSYRKVISMKKNSNNYLQGSQTDNLGNICLIYNGNTYCLLEIVLKSILTHNSIIITSESNYMKATNELIVILVKRILKAYNVDENLVQILYTSRIEELLSNNISINKVIAIGNRQFQERIKKISTIEVLCRGYDNYDIYIENIENLAFINEILKEQPNIELYVKEGLEVPFEDYMEVGNIDEAIAQINFNTSRYSSSIFTSDKENAVKFLREIKSCNVSVNSSPLLQNFIDIDINEFLIKKNMFYPNPLSNKNEKNRFEFPLNKSSFRENSQDENKKI